MRLFASLISLLYVIFALANTAEAFQIRSYATGERLFQVCSGDRDSCYMYVYGVLDLMMMNDDAAKTCSFNADGVSGDKAVNAVLSYLKTHQDRMDWSAAAIVQNAIRAKFPCAKKKATDAAPAIQP